MKRRALRKDFYMEIRKSMGRFLSILFIVALGVAFFSGIRSAEPDMRLSADEYFDEHKLMDLEVIGTLGLTKSDLSEIRNVAGVGTAEGSVSVDVLCNEEDSQQVLHVMSVLSDMNKISVVEGRLPSKQGECLMDSRYMDSSSFKVGDSIRLESGTSDPITDTLKTDTYKIVGVGNSPQYISFGRGSTSIGTGDISGFMFVSPSDFKLDVFTEIYIRADKADKETAFTDGYDKITEKTQKNIKKIADSRSVIRRDELKDDAESELNDAKKKLEDGKKEAEDKLVAAAQELADGEQKLNDGKAQIADGQKAIADAKSTLSAKQKELKAGRAEYDSGKKQLESGKAELKAQEDVLLQKESDINSQFQGAESQLNDARNQLDSGWNEYHVNEGLLAKTEASLKEAQDNLAALEQDPDADQEQLEQLRGAVAQLSAAKEQISASLAEAKNTLDAKEAQYTAGKQELDAQKAEASAGIEQGKSQLAAAKQQLAESETKLASALSTIQSGQSQIDSGWSELKKKEAELTTAAAAIPDSEAKLLDGKKEYEEGKQKAEDEIKVNEDKLKDAQEQINKIEMPKWYVEDRSILPEHSGYGDNADRIKAIGKVFPVLFFLVAALISLTTMTRMVEEQRVHIGTMKALGYSKLAIAGKYLGYAFLATVGGSIIGVLIGEKILPYIIITAYKIMYLHMPNVVIPYNLTYALMASLAAIFCTMAATVFACYKELSAQPAVLMRPPAPKQGKRVLIERITFLWKHLSFTWKSTIRNLIRYKKRFLMTVFGIGGCMALMIVGFGIKDSIFEIGTLQYSELQSYQGTAYLRDSRTSDQKKELLEGMEKDAGISDSTQAFQKKIEVSAGANKQDVYLTVPEDTAKINDFITFRSRVRKDTYNLKDNGAILTEKMAKTLGVKKGDSISIKAGGESKKVKISEITENYMGHFLYVSPKLYEEVYGEVPDYNSVLFKTKDTEGTSLKKTGEKLLSYEAVLNVNYTDNMEDRLNDMLKSLNMVIIVLIISAGMLAFVVLYNLNNININERKRELATIKVLGFYDMEVGEYVYRENILITIIGAMAGIVMGILLHRYIIVTVEIEELMFGRTINFSSFVYSVLFTIGFSLFVNWVMYFKLKKIDMVESLKSVE